MFARQRSHFNAPYPLEDDPASHRVHDSIAAREYEPGGHFAQKEIPGSDPIGQEEQELLRLQQEQIKRRLELQVVKIEFEQKFPVMNRSLLMKPNENSFYYGSYYDKNGKPAKSLSQTVYQYNFDKSGRIKEELEYCPYAEDSIPVKTIKKSDLNTRKIFLYNKKNQVVVLKITPGEYGKNMGHYNDFATESPYCQDLQLKYAYDSKGRITQVIMFGCGKIVAQEDYKYDNSKNYVSEVKRYRCGLGSDDYKNTISFYNELGDIIKKELNPINPNENSIRESKYRYYDYEYDKHNNWIRCRMFLEGNHEGEPSIILEREIEYYNEQKAK